MDKTLQAQIIDQETALKELRVVRFADLLVRHVDEDEGLFIPLAPSGAQPERELVEEAAEVPEEEIGQRRLEQIERETYQRVFAAAEQAGLEMGRQKMEQELAEVLPRLETLLRGLEELPARMFAANHRMLVETAMLLVRELLGHELQTNPEELADRIGRELERMGEQDNIRLYLAPRDVPFLQRIRDFKRLRLESDPAVAPGSFRLESAFGGMESNLDEQLREVEQTLREYLRERLEKIETPEGTAQAREVVNQLGEAAAEALAARDLAARDLVDVEGQQEEALSGSAPVAGPADEILPVPEAAPIEVGDLETTGPESAP
ncbi:MAG: hypothetical protein HQL82_12325 [Magnetococcales bacterium]|nr:hypothetical protein [Magnetococcales bacterium]